MRGSRHFSQGGGGPNSQNGSAAGLTENFNMAFNQNQVDPSCLLCHQEDETVEHFLLRCPALASVRNPIIDNILSVGAGIYSPTNSPVSFLQLITRS